MTDGQVRQIADAVLYEAYILYPYRPSSTKNQYRWTFGVVYPRPFAERSSGADDWQMQTECLLQPRGDAVVEIKVRFLQVIDETVAEQEVTFDGALSDLVEQARQQSFFFPLKGRNDERLEGMLLVSARQCERDIVKLRARIENTTPLSRDHSTNRNQAILRSLVSTHTILTVRGAEFVSHLEPPADVSDVADSCENIGTWPVLVGDRCARDVMLSSPIILYDFPQVAPESPGDLFDGTEIDELLSLRVQTMTSDEKREASAWDERARQLLDRTDSLGADQLNILHGAARNWHTSIRVGDVDLTTGSQVRLKPRGRADAIDLLLHGKLATIQSIEQDLENNLYVAVTVDDDPGRDFGQQGKIGHRFFFRLDEIVPLPNDGAAR